LAGGDGDQKLLGSFPNFESVEVRQVRSGKCVEKVGVVTTSRARIYVFPLLPNRGKGKMKGIPDLTPKRARDRILRVHHVAEILGTPARTVRYWAETGELPAFKAGRSWRFSEADILAYKARQRNVSATPADSATVA
jgi:excisionase family DNA binding protein